MYLYVVAFTCFQGLTGLLVLLPIPNFSCLSSKGPMDTKADDFDMQDPRIYKVDNKFHNCT